MTDAQYLVAIVSIILVGGAIYHTIRIIRKKDD